eukprot:3521370-Pleurochrysis_carterae.AAC.1
MSCGDNNPEANMTLSVSLLLWIQTERAPVKGETISPVASWQYQAAGPGAQEYIPHSADCPAFYDSNSQPTIENSPENLAAAVKETLATMLGHASEIWDENFILTLRDLGVLRFWRAPCRWEICSAEDLNSTDIGKMVRIPGCYAEARLMIVLACPSMPPNDANWVKREGHRDGDYHAEPHAASSPWYQGLPFMRWVDQFLMQPNAWVAPLLAAPVYL